MNKLFECVSGHNQVLLKLGVFTRAENKGTQFHQKFFRVTKIVCIAHVWLARRKAHKTLLSPPQQNSAIHGQLFCFVAAFKAREHPEMPTQHQIHAWTACFLMRHVSFYGGAPHNPVC